jgi:hypothetical protein
MRMPPHAFLPTSLTLFQNLRNFPKLIFSSNNGKVHNDKKNRSYVFVFTIKRCQHLSHHIKDLMVLIPQAT